MIALGRGLSLAVKQRTALAFSFGARLLVAYACASPLARVLLGSGVANHPRGDAVLFDAGGVRLVEAVRTSLPELRAELPGSFLVGAIGAWLLLIPHGALFASLRLPERGRLSELVPSSFRLFPRFTLLGGAFAFIQGLTLLIAAIAASGVEHRFGVTGAERHADFGAFGVISAGALFAVFAAIWLDLARAAVVADDARFFDALRVGFTTLVRRPLATLSSWAAAPVALAVSFVLVAVVVGHIDVSRAGVWRVILVFVLHQLVIVVWLVLRAAWLGAALELVERTVPEQPSTPENVLSSKQ